MYGTEYVDGLRFPIFISCAFILVVALGLVALFLIKGETKNVSGSPIEMEDDAFAEAMSGKPWAEVAEAHLRSY